ncbi:MAG TPA: TonB-dependent receptor, partial [Caldimonas sp.]
MAKQTSKRPSLTFGWRTAMRRPPAASLAIASCAWPLALFAQTAPIEGGGIRVAPVVVTATRTEVAPFDVPASIDRIGGDAIRDGRLQVNISESLGGVPGLLARDRQNYAQDVQISVRGFGARSTFGIRGVRLYVDGIPATLPDGQGQITNVDLGSAERIEVLRGPFSALYGNSAGGVIQVFSEEGSGPPTFATSVAGGSYGTSRVGAKASGAIGTFGYVVSGSIFNTDGYRDHSAAERRIANAKLTWRPDDADKWTLVVNSVALPTAFDPLGLTRAQFDTDPRGVDPSATMFDTRKSVDQTQLGLIYERRLDAVNSLRALV